jgi:hypothetical protein
VREWIPYGQGKASLAAGLPLHTMRNGIECSCICRSPSKCSMVEAARVIDGVRVVVSSSNPDLISPDQYVLIMDTFKPAANNRIYTSQEEIPPAFSLPPAEEIPINSNGIQELTLVVSAEGYTPVHFAVKKGVPVRLIFKQLGQVVSGNELVFTWGEGKNALLTLASPTDIKDLEFVPEQTGQFQFNCPHLMYRGMMTVRD